MPQDNNKVPPEPHVVPEDEESRKDTGPHDQGGRRDRRGGGR